MRVAVASGDLTNIMEFDYKKHLYKHLKCEGYFIPLMFSDMSRCDKCTLVVKGEDVNYSFHLKK